MGVEIADVHATRATGVLLEDYSANVRVRKALAHRVRVLVGVDVELVVGMFGATPARRDLEGDGALRKKHTID